jgi:hypothetical protein
MRLLPFLSAVSVLLAGACTEQQREPAHAINCTPNKGKPDYNPEQAERQCLGQLSGLATRSGDLLHLTLENGKTKTFKDEREACQRHDVGQCLVYRLTAYHPAQKLFVIEQAAYESFRVAAVHRHGGSLTWLDDHPHIAPGGKRLVTVFSPDAWDTERDIAIYSIAPDSLSWNGSTSTRTMNPGISWLGTARSALSSGSDRTSRMRVGTPHTPPGAQRSDEPRLVGS